MALSLAFFFAPCDDGGAAQKRKRLSLRKAVPAVIDLQQAISKES
jgi:hypothetical protein